MKQHDTIASTMKRYRSLSSKRDAIQLSPRATVMQHGLGKINILIPPYYTGEFRIFQCFPL